MKHTSRLNITGEEKEAVVIRLGLLISSLHPRPSILHLLSVHPPPLFPPPSTLHLPHLPLLVPNYTG